MATPGDWEMEAILAKERAEGHPEAMFVIGDYGPESEWTEFLFTQAWNIRLKPTIRIIDWDPVA